MSNVKRVLGQVSVRVTWETVGEGLGDCAVFVSPGDWRMSRLVDESIVQIPEYSSGDRMAMVSTMMVFYMQDVLIAPGDALQLGKMECVGEVEDGGKVSRKCLVTLECETEGEGRLIGYRMDRSSDGRAVLRGIGMKRRWDV